MSTRTTRLVVSIVCLVVATASLGGPAMAASVGAADPAERPTGLPAIASTVGGDAPTAQQVAPDQFEPNDDFRSATLVDPGTYSGLSITSGDVDVYAVELDGGEALSTSITLSNAAGDLDLFLVGPGQDEVLQASTTSADTETISHLATEPGTYYVVVVGYQGATGSYELTVDRTGGAAPATPTVTPGPTPTPDDTPTSTTPDATPATPDDTPTSTTPDATPATPDDTPTDAGEVEPNDGFDTATPVEPGTYADRELTEGDIDFYSVELEPGEALSASIAFSNAAGDLDMVLVGPDQDEVLQSSTGTGDTEAITHVATEGGTYYVVVYGYQGATGSYDLTVDRTGGSGPSVPDGPGEPTPTTEPTETPATPDETPTTPGETPSEPTPTPDTPPTAGEVEPNDDFENATIVEPGNYTDRSITENDVDVYGVALNESETLSASIAFSNAEGDLDLLLVDPNVTEVLQVSSTTNDTESVSHVATESGTHYLVVVGSQGATNSYNLTVETASGTDGPSMPDNDSESPPVESDFEPNDDFDNATGIGPGTYSNLSITENDVDIYGVELNSSETLSASITFSNAEGDLDLFLVDPNVTQVLVSSTTVSDEENLTHVATEAGTHYLVVAGYQGATATYNLTVDRSSAANESLPDPPSDRLGWENGYWANESIDIDQSDGLSADERQALLARSKARVEAIRGLEFRRNVSFNIVGREAFNQRLNRSRPSRDQQDGLTTYYNQVYEATFIVDEETDAYDEVAGELGVSVGGFYVPGTDQFTLITEDPDQPMVNEGVLVHELVHALQDQYNLTAFSEDATADGYRAGLGLSEGEANYVQYRYEQRCRDDWECLPTPMTGGGGGDDGAEPNLGVFLVSFQPYSDGPVLVDRLYQQGGWNAVTAAYDNPPASTEQVVHPERYPDEAPATITFEPDPSAEWELFTTERIGEAWLYSMFWYQARQTGADVVDPSSIADPEGGQFDTYNYTSAPSEGWGNDRLYIYTDGSERGYVWQTAWDSETDAEQFYEAYTTVLTAQGAERTGDGRWVIPENRSYADAFSVTRDGTRVTIVNAPAPDRLSELAPTVVGAPANETGTATVNETATPTANESTTATEA